MQKKIWVRKQIQETRENPWERKQAPKVRTNFGNANKPLGT